MHKYINKKKMWYNEFNSVFFITIFTLLFGSIGVCLKYCLKSKCDIVMLHCLGCGINIHRNVEVEIENESQEP